MMVGSFLESLLAGESFLGKVIYSQGFRDSGKLPPQPRVKRGGNSYAIGTTRSRVCYQLRLLEFYNAIIFSILQSMQTGV